MPDQVNTNSPTYSTDVPSGGGSYSLSYDGTSQSSYVPSTSFDTSSDFSAFFRFKGDGDGSVRYMFSQEDEAQISQSLAAWIQSGTISVWNGSGVVATWSVPDAGWHSFGFSVYGGTWHFYADGSPLTTSSSPNPPSSSRNIFLAGAPGAGVVHGAYYNGILDNVFVSQQSADDTDFLNAHSSGTPLPGAIYTINFEEGPPSPPSTNGAANIIRRQRLARAA